MANPTEIKRKHFRFPAYDDEMGVKLTSENKRSLFSNEEEGTYASNTVAASIKDPVTFQYEMAEPSEKKTTTRTASQNQEQIEELAKHKSNLPNYMMSHNKTGIQQKKSGLFDSSFKKSAYGNGFKRAGNTSSKPVINDYSYNGRSYFVPKYIPASVIPDAEKPTVSEQELSKAMKKNQSSYLLFDEEPTAFQVKNNEDPTVKKFNRPKQSPEIPVTRRQYQQIKPDMERFGKEDISHSLPRSRKELKNAKEKAKGQTAYGQKVATAETEQAKKKSILDKPLKGIIEDSNDQLENSKYFS